MTVRFFLNSSDEELSESQVVLLSEWLQEDGFSLSMIRKDVSPNSAGIGIFEGIIAVLGTEFAIKLSSSIIVWMKERTKQKEIEKSKLSMTIENSKGDKITISSENLSKKDNELVEEISSHILREND